MPDAFSHKLPLSHKKMTRSVCCGKRSDTHMSLYKKTNFIQAELLAELFLFQAELSAAFIFVAQCNIIMNKLVILVIIFSFISVLLICMTMLFGLHNDVMISFMLAMQME